MSIPVPESAGQTAAYISVDFNSFSSCCDAFSRLLWPSDTTSLLHPYIQHVVISPPPQLLQADILPLLARLSQFCESSQSAFNFAHAAELVVLASSNSLETAHHKMFLFGTASALQLRTAENPNHQTSSAGIFRKRRLHESLAVISELLIALNLAPLHFRAQVCINDAFQHDVILDFLHASKSESTRLSLPLEFHAELASSFRQQVQIALSGIGDSAPLVLSYDDHSIPLDIIDTATKNETFERCDALAVNQLSSASVATSDLLSSISRISDFRAISAEIVQKLVAQVASRFVSSTPSEIEAERRMIESACSRLLQSVVFEVSKRFQSGILAVDGRNEEPTEIVAIGGTHGSELGPSQENRDEPKPLIARTGAIYGRHPSYRTPVPQVEVISVEQVNPVWTHQCKPGSRICILLRCQQRLSGAEGLI